jgi:hypothetical protein
LKTTVGWKSPSATATKASPTGDRLVLAADREEPLLVLRLGEFLSTCAFRDLVENGVPKTLPRHQESTSPVGARS